MGRYIKLFNLTSEYQAYINSPNMILPNVSCCKDNNANIYYHPILQGAKVLCKYNITDTTSPTIVLSGTGNISSMEVDGVEQEVTTSYTFNTTGEHTVLFTLAEGVTSIGQGTFSGCSRLITVIIGNSITSIVNSAFANCIGLTSIIISNSVTSIGVGAFANCVGLTGITIPDSVTEIGSGAFSGCSGLTNVIIGNSVTSIGGGAFSNCSGLISVTIPNSVTSISSGAFASCSSITSIICNATTAPIISSDTFDSIAQNGTLTVPTGSTGYDVWMGTGNYYLGKYNWTKVEA